ncbi:hypothetical protein LOZ34_002033 [Ophidiomyces ophidiicola]|nr:hypothetical protein LOZ47_000092 [Ophidiomyces ophidiicola]KAI2108564.1 hypothetical protein LOZ34_002033 [Ophidiomyces ophidiicola]KAI2117297.1 hypothetical protein LOZ42_002597 [Ophidiomyces ophidiicola]KAI2120578.1 hypothetical protein LOZ32_002563 [Ophidiomyces ophidiicola]KAI2172110.1 hypothetical protein LOZ23_000093 [Ophidiomyces ophidiicola]
MASIQLFFQDTDNSHEVSESDQSNILTTQFNSEFNAQSNSDDVNMLCDDSAVSSADAVQNQLLADYLINNILNILNVSDHESVPAYSGAENQHECGVEQTDASKKPAITEQAGKLSAQC